MSREFLSPVRFVVVPAFPTGPTVGDSVVLLSNGHLHTFDGTAWVDNGSVAAGGNSGVGEVDFGAGLAETSLVVTGQTAITANSPVVVSLLARATSNNTVDDHNLASEDLRVWAGAIVAGVSFTIFASTRVDASPGAERPALAGLHSIAWRY